MASWIEVAPPWEQMDRLEVAVKRHAFNLAQRGKVMIDDELPPVFFDVRDYGAVGDGVTDDTVAIQAALDAAEAYATQTGRKVAVRLHAGNVLKGPQNDRS